MVLIKNAVNMIILNEDNEILLIKRSPDETVEPCRWCIPGGSVEINENFEDALTREIMEEIGTNIISCKYHKSYHVNSSIPVRAVYFYGKIDGDIKLNHESTEYCWFNIKDIDNQEMAFNQKDVLIDFIKTLNES